MSVYFIQAGHGGPIKIGFSKDIAKRMSELQVGQAAPLRLLAKVPGARMEESSFHEAFADLNIGGEWFKPEQKLLNWIKRLRGEKCTSLDHILTRYDGASATVAMVILLEILREMPREEIDTLIEQAKETGKPKPRGKPAKVFTFKLRMANGELA